MKKISLLLGLIAPFVYTTSFGEINLVNGVYYGMTVGGQYMTDFKDAPIPAIPTIPITPTQGIYSNQIGVTAGFQVGYRFFDRYRVEGEIQYARTKISSVKSTTNVIIAATPTASLDGSNQNFGFLFNGYIDLITHQKHSDSLTAPYIGLGIGYTGMKTGTNINQSTTPGATGPLLATIGQGQQSILMYQGILGLSHFLDDFTSIGVDYRYQSFGTIKVYNDKGHAHNFSITLNFAYG
jgi:opacity protein-like surface antigen